MKKTLQTWLAENSAAYIEPVPPAFGKGWALFPNSVRDTAAYRDLWHLSDVKVRSVCGPWLHLWPVE